MQQQSRIQLLENLIKESARYETLEFSDKISFLKKIGQIGKTQQKKYSGYVSICPYTKEPLYRECGLKTCPFWVNHQFTKNCALDYMASVEQDHLSLDQIAFLFDKDLVRVDTLHKEVFKLVQRHLLKEALKEKEVKRFDYLSGYCVHCQTKLTEDDLEDPKLALEDGFGYCSSECKKALPPDFFKLERFFGTDILTLVKEGSDLFNFYYLEEVLGFQPNVLRNRLEKLKKSGQLET